MARKKRKNVGPCKVEDCEKDSKSMNMCGAHYMQYRRGARSSAGVLLRSLKQTREGCCVVTGCTEEITGRRLCSRHYQQWQSGHRTLEGDLLAEVVERNSGPRELSRRQRRQRGMRSGKCKLCSSNMFHGGTGFCSKHYARFNRGQIDSEGNELRALQRVGSYTDKDRCLVKGCSKKPKSQWMCGTHAQQRTTGIIDECGNKLREPKHKGPRGGKDRWTTSNGYIRKRTPGHPKADKYGFVLEHRLVTEEKLGRHLTSDEIVHHKDGVPGNNDPSNLEVLTKNLHPPGHSYDKKTAVVILLQDEGLPKALRRELEKLN